MLERFGMRERVQKSSTVNLLTHATVLVPGKVAVEFILSSPGVRTMATAGIRANPYTYGPDALLPASCTIGIVYCSLHGYE